ncbi:MAG: hypothetical protein NZT61_06845 [Deltaproteobacteria bacterium]|nr:hypothetical protein [Deltaproteobacteria bacterium]MCX7953029.1 hypothetical protein [Deltaproteobacteria bacterium]
MFRFSVIELKRQLAYPVTFIIKLILPSIVKILGVFLIWQAVIYENPGGLKDYSASFLSGYSILAPAIYVFLRPEHGFIIREVYDGTIQRYFLLPVSFFSIAFSRHLGFLIARMPEILVAFCITIYLSGSQLSLFQFLVFLCFCFMSSILLFLCFCAAELVSLVLEEGWSISHILDRIVMVLSGMAFPITMLPDSALKILQLTPFPLMSFVPTYQLLNPSGASFSFEIVKLLMLYSVWILLFALLSHALYETGRKTYSPYGT